MPQLHYDQVSERDLLEAAANVSSSAKARVQAIRVADALVRGAVPSAIQTPFSEGQFGRPVRIPERFKL
jgi:hypothetical protein